MPSLLAKFRPLLLAAWLALGAQGLLVFEAAWHHHDDAANHQDSCAVCAAVAQHSQPVDPPDALPAPALSHVLDVLGGPAAAHCFPLPHLTSRGPPSTAGV